MDIKVKEVTKLDFKDVLIEPREASKSLTRKDINIEIDWLDTTVHPIAIANMTSTGTYKIANILTPMRFFTFIHKEYTLEEHLNNLQEIKDSRGNEYSPELILCVTSPTMYTLSISVPVFISTKTLSPIVIKGQP